MINVTEQQDLLLNLAKKLKKKITAYAVGGTAMMFQGMKDATKDIDLVFTNEEDRIIFEEAAKGTGYTKMSSVIVYGAEKQNQPIMLTRQKGKAERFDLFLNHVISFTFSENMQSRAKNTYEFGDKLVLKIADAHDLIILKCATDRQRDAEDVKTIIEKQRVDWKIVVEEAKHQVKLGKSTAIMELGAFLEKLRNELKVNIPEAIIDELNGILIKQIKEKKQLKT
jgi:predicted nucleotidyltransferase